MTTMRGAIYDCHIAKAFALRELCLSKSFYIWQMTLGIQPKFSIEEIDYVCHSVAEEFYATLPIVYGENPITKFKEVVTFVLTQLTPDIAKYFFTKQIRNNEEFETQVFKMFMYIITGQLEE